MNNNIINNTYSAETWQRRHLYLPTRVENSTTATVHWESQPVLTWMFSLMNPPQEEEITPAFAAPTIVPKQQAERYQRLVEHSRARSMHATLWNEYQTIQSLHHFLMNQISSQWPVNGAEYPLALERLNHETSDRLEALLLSPSSMASTEAKADMAQYMTKWLRDNWINPYPDDIVLNEMAAHCGTPPSVIGNWLINARTRKWRPAIAKAMQLHRPAKYLLEDSLCLFDGRPIQPRRCERCSDFGAPAVGDCGRR